MRDSGLYILVLELKERQRIKPGRLPETEFERGTYFYVGRARCGLSKRLERHLRKRKKLFWHIDYLLRKAEVVNIWIKPNSFDECRTVRQIRKSVKDSIIPLKKFGASDCRCPGHLIYLPEVEDLENLRKRIALEKPEIRE